MDPFILTHQLEPLFYDISSNLNPASIPDQMFRGYMIIRRAVSAEIIVPGQDLPLLVIGAGVAGAMAAMTAAEHKIPVVMVEQKTPFVRQSTSRSRYVCPTQYDWPAPHWREGKYPWAGPRMPLIWNSNHASAVALAWNSQLNQMQKLWPHLRLRSKTKVTRCAVVEHQSKKIVEAEFNPDRRNLPRHYSLAISCIGFGDEVCSVPKDVPEFTGYGFWDVDKYGEANLGLPKEIKPNVLISGSGDGALQDFLRIATGLKSARDLVDGLPPETLTAIEGPIRVAENYAHRAFIWAKVGPFDHAIHHKLHDQHQKAVDSLASDSGLWKKIVKALDRLVIISPDRLSIQLVYPCDHFSSSYPLNRFLVLLIAQYIKEKYRKQKIEVLRPNMKVMSIRGVGDHHCLNKPYLCYGENHEICFVPANCHDFHVAGREGEHSVVEGSPFNVIIVHHGVTPNPNPLSDKPLPPRRQVLPYSVEE